ncbi:MAG: response regulator transcription factor [Pseudomonadota bacterium]
MPLSILVVDDHELVRDGITARLEDEQDIVVVGQGENGPQAVALAKRLKPDLVMLDINMPQMNGLDAASKIRAAGLPCALLILSLYDNPEYVARAKTIGANGYVLKDVSQQAMVDAIHAAHRHFTQTDQNFHTCASVAAAPEADNPYNLTEREIQILSAIARGRLNKQIAADLDISVRTVESHRSAIRQKTGGGNAAHLARIAADMGLTS